MVGPTKRRQRGRKESHMDDYGHQTTATGKTFGMPEPLRMYWLSLHRKTGKELGVPGFVRKATSKRFSSDVQNQAYQTAYHKRTFYGLQLCENPPEASASAKVTKDPDLS